MTVAEGLSYCSTEILRQGECKNHFLDHVNLTNALQMLFPTKEGIL